MDEATIRLVEQLAVQRFIVKYWESLDKPRHMLSLANEELANLIAPSLLWRTMSGYNEDDT